MRFSRWIANNLTRIILIACVFLIGLFIGLPLHFSHVASFIRIILCIFEPAAVGHLLLAVTAAFAFLAFLLSLYGPPVRLNVSIREKKDRYGNIRKIIDVMIANESSQPVRPLQIILEIKNSNGKTLVGQKKNKHGDSRLRFKSDIFEAYSVTATWLQKFKILEPYDRKTYCIPYEEIKNHLKTKNRHMAEGDKTKIMEEGSRLYAGVEVPVARPAWFCWLKCYPDRYVESTRDLDGQEAYLEITGDLKETVKAALQTQPANRN